MLGIEKVVVPVNKKTNKLEIDTTEKGQVYIVQGNGEVIMYPLPAFGSVEFPAQNYQVGKPLYQIRAN